MSTIAIKKTLKSLPDKSGIYLFYNHKKSLIYIGRATSLKNRVRSYFSGPKTLRPIEEMIDQVKTIKWITTNSVLESIILEGNYIKKYRPIYNIQWRDDKSWNYLAITKDEYPQLVAVREHELITTKLPNATKLQKIHLTKIFGPYPQMKTAATLKLLRQLFHYSTCKPHSDRACFYRQLDQCLGVCTGEISISEYKQRVIKPLTMFLSGKTKQVITELTKQMKTLAKDHYFEEAAVIRNQIKNLKHIQDIALITSTEVHNDQSPITNHQFTIEGYDISNLGESGKVGGLVAFNQHGPIKSGYKKFKIKTVVGQSDVDCLREVLSRRLKHEDWPWPDYFLIDGGKPQLRAAVETLQKYNCHRPVIGIAKGADRRKNEFILASREPEVIAFVTNHKHTLIQARDEAHRFAITYQKQLRKIK